MYDEWFAFSSAVQIARKSPCQKSKRGVVIWDRKIGILASAFNAPPAGFYCAGDICRANCNKVCLHAEESAIITALSGSVQPVVIRNAEMLHIKVNEQGAPVVSGQPSCVECSRKIIASGLTGIWLYQKSDKDFEPNLEFYNSNEFHRATLRNLNLPIKTKI